MHCRQLEKLVSQMKLYLDALLCLPLHSCDGNNAQYVISVQGEDLSDVPCTKNTHSNQRPTV